MEYLYQNWSFLLFIGIISYLAYKFIGSYGEQNNDKKDKQISKSSRKK
jgi:hypothetical protein